MSSKVIQNDMVYCDKCGYFMSKEHYDNHKCV